MESLIDVDPEKELVIHGPFSESKEDAHKDEVTFHIRSRHAESVVTFKVSASEPNIYRFEPAYGTIESGKDQLIRVKVSAFTYKAQDKETHRIIVSAMVYDSVAGSVGSDATEFWNGVDREPGKMVTEQILTIKLEPTQAELQKCQNGLQQLNKIHQTDALPEIGEEGGEENLVENTTTISTNGNNTVGQPESERKDSPKFLIHSTASKMKPRKVSDPGKRNYVIDTTSSDSSDYFANSPGSRKRFVSPASNKIEAYSKNETADTLRKTLRVTETELEALKKDRELLKHYYRKTDRASDGLKSEYNQLMKAGVKEKLKTMYSIQVFTLLCLLFGLSYFLNNFLMKYFVGHRQS